MPSDTFSLDSIMKDLYPMPGQRIKQWVVDRRREDAWAQATCPKFFIPSHVDNTGLECRNATGLTPWCRLAHDCCQTCDVLEEVLRGRDEVVNWVAERELRPPIESDRSKLSDEVQPDFGPSPLFSFIKRDR